jgi:hypothetical protein
MHNIANNNSPTNTKLITQGLIKSRVELIVRRQNRAAQTESALGLDHRHNMLPGRNQVDHNTLRKSSYLSDRDHLQPYKL